jgi:3-isopropylmalate dehydrogenase
MLLSVELMLRHSFAMHDAADQLANAIEGILIEGWRTRDIAGADTPAERIIGTTEMGDLVAETIAAE